MAALDQTTPFTHEGDYYTATVQLRSDLTWTDGGLFTAEDVAFTVNTALNFELGFDWKAYYDYDYLDHVEALNPTAVKYYFKKTPNVGAWQYGALQGPIVQKDYWNFRVTQAAGLLPQETLDTEISEAMAQQTALQKEVSGLNAKVLSIQQSGGQDRQLEAELKRKSGNLDAANNHLAELKDQIDTEYNQARIALYSLDDLDEPTLGNWTPAGSEDGVWINATNPDFPFGQPNFDRASYRGFADEDSAVNALQTNQVDAIIDAQGISANAIKRLSADDSIRVQNYTTRSTSFLIINFTNPSLSNPALHQAIACLLENNLMESPVLLEGSGWTGSFVAESYWRGQPEDRLCMSLEANARLEMAVSIMKTAGYSWQVQPTPAVYGENLRSPSGESVLPVSLLVSISDPLRIEAARLIENHINRLGIPLSISMLDNNVINYRIFSSDRYDMAILGWNLSPYPGYLCDWFGESNPFHYENPRIASICTNLLQESNLEMARADVKEMLTALSEDLPFIPLYSQGTTEAYRNVAFPFEDVPDGLSSLYGAPSLALPSP